MLPGWMIMPLPLTLELQLVAATPGLVPMAPAVPPAMTPFVPPAAWQFADATVVP